VIQSVASAYGSSVDQQSIANSAGLNTGGIMTYQTFTSYLNNYTGGRYNYFYSNNGAFGAADRDAFRTAVASCLMSGKPVVVVVERSVLGLPAGRSYAVIYSATPQADQYSLYVPGLQGQANQASATFDGIINAMAQAGYVLRIY
jgi:predicted Zn-dependent protease